MSFQDESGACTAGDQSTPIPLADYLQTRINSDPQNYCMRGHQILATNNPHAFLDNPSTYPYSPRKVASVLNYDSFAECFDAHLCDPMCEVLVPFAPCALHPIRLGLSSNLETSSIVLLVIIKGDNSNVAESEGASKLLIDLKAILSEHWQGDSVYIDIVKTFIPRLYPQNFTPRSYPQNISSLDCNVTDSCAQFFHQEFPPSGSSFGNGGLTGTFTGPIKHTTPEAINYFALSCSHVVPEDGVVYSPTQQDLSSTAAIIDRKIRAVKIHKSGKLDHWQKVKTHMEVYNNQLGTRFAISDPEGDFDWGLVKFASHKLNLGSLIAKHTRYDENDLSSGFSCLPSTNFGESDIDKAVKHFHPGPPYLPVSTIHLKKHSIVLKPPSRTTQKWSLGENNDIRSALVFSESGKTRKYCFIAQDKSEGAAFSKPGDSGSIVLDRNYNPVGMIIAGQEAVVSNGTSWPDLTLAHDIRDVFADIESKLGWEAGSVSFA